MTNYVPYKCDGQWGYIDRLGLNVIEPEYDSVALFNEGLAVVERNNKFGLIDTNGILVLPIQFEIVYAYDKENEFVKTRKNSEWKYFDRNGQMIKVDTIRMSWLYDCVSSTISSGLAHVYLYESNGKIGFVKYLCNNINEDTCRVLQELLYTDFLEIGWDYILLKDDNDWNLYNYEGELLKALNIDNVQKKPIGRAGNEFYLFEFDRKYGLMNIEGEIIVETKYDSITQLKEGFYLQSKEWYWSKEELLLVKVDNDYFYIDQNGIEYRCKK
jgi:hypothetical protein